MTPDETRIMARALGAIARSQAALDGEGRARLRALPVRRALEALDAYPDGVDLTFVSPDMEVLDAEVNVLGGEGWVSWYWNLVALHLVARGLQSPRPFTLPPSVLEELLQNLERIVGEAASHVERSDPLGDDEFLLDIGLSRGVVVPFRTVLGVAPAWLPESSNLARGPWIEGHFRSLDDGFDLEVMKAAAEPIIDFFAANENYQGWFGYTWLADPNLAEVSPHLSWYRELLLAGGAEVTAHASDHQTVADATETSSTRRSLFEQGRYKPRDYRIVVPREQMLTWSGRLPELFE